jgi:cell division protein FtsI/penicillin-binding protein 2
MKAELTWRYLLGGTLLSILPVLIVIQLIRLQTDPKQVQQFTLQKETFIERVTEITPPRGLIFDRWGALLAGDQMVYEIGLELQEVTNPNTLALATSLVLGSDYADMFSLASTPYIEGESVYVVLWPNASREQARKLSEMRQQFRDQYGQMKDKNKPSLEGLRFVPHLQRVYPEKSLASNVMGFLNLAGEAFFGVEEKYNERLAGKKKLVRVSEDPVGAEVLPEVPEGASLVLTIDRAIQASMEELIDDAVDSNGARSGTIIVLDPRSGEILAMATTYRLNLNEYWRYGEVFEGETPFNPAISTAYEPGSVFKVMPMAAALNSGTVTPDTQFLDRGFIDIGGTIIRNWDGGAWGPQDMTGCMQHSLNVCLAWLAQKMGPATFYEYMQRFGIGHLTGIDMAGENPGRLKLPGDYDWYEADLGTNAFGQGVAATPLQMAVAVSAIANDGQIMEPHIVRSLVSKGYQTDIEQRVASMPVSAETAHTLTEMLARALEVEASDALVTGYRVAGKTGTGEIPTPFGYDTFETNASFVGWGPADDPRFVIYLWLERPKSSQWASEVAAPVFSEAVERLVVLLNLPPDDVRQQLYGH